MTPTERAWLAPAFRVAFERAKSGAARTAYGTAHFTWTVARLSACPVRFADDPEEPSVELRPCASFDAGTLTGVGTETVEAETDTAPWYAAGGVLRVSWLPLSVLVVEAEGGLSFPLRRDFFRFLPSTDVYRVPSSGVMLGLALAFRLP